MYARVCRVAASNGAKQSWRKMTRMIA